MIRLLTALLVFCFAIPAHAKPLVADISIHDIKIDSGFTGTEILLFGAKNEAGDLVVVLRGPEKDFIVRRKEQVFGIWMHREEVRIDDAPVYYALASTRPIDNIRNPRLLNTLQLGTDHLLHKPINHSEEEQEEFYDAFLRNRKNMRLYPGSDGLITFMGETLFRTVINIPDSIPRGTYTAEAYLISEDQLLGMQVTPLSVTKTGFDAFIFDLAHEHPYFYGAVAILLALFAGWVAGLIFSKV